MKRAIVIGVMGLLLWGGSHPARAVGFWRFAWGGLYRVEKVWQEQTDPLYQNPYFLEQDSLGRSHAGLSLEAQQRVAATDRASLWFGLSGHWARLSLKGHAPASFIISGKESWGLAVAVASQMPVSSRFSLEFGIALGPEGYRQDWQVKLASLKTLEGQTATVEYEEWGLGLSYRLRLGGHISLAPWLGRGWRASLLYEPGLLRYRARVSEEVREFVHEGNGYSSFFHQFALLMSYDLRWR